MRGGVAARARTDDHLRVGAHERADVAEHSLPNGQRELVDVLMRERKAEAVFAGLGFSQSHQSPLSAIREETTTVDLYQQYIAINCNPHADLQGPLFINEL